MAKTKGKLKLKPSARENRHWLLIAEKSNEKIEKIILEYLGVLGFAESGYMKVKSSKTNTVSSVTRKSVDNVRAALSMAGITIEKVSGTLKGLGK
jgi:RNase P/RNase MRP subunit POP5